MKVYVVELQVNYESHILDIYKNLKDAEEYVRKALLSDQDKPNPCNQGPFYDIYEREIK